MTTYVVCRKGEDGQRRYLVTDERRTRDFEAANKYTTADEARDCAEALNAQQTGAGYLWHACEVQTDHETGWPFVWRTVPSPGCLRGDTTP